MNDKFTYKPQGVCSSNLEFELNDGVIGEVRFTGGCSGNLQGIAALVKGKNAQDVVALLKGITCGYKSTSCPDQLAFALEQAMENKESSGRRADNGTVGDA